MLLRLLESPGAGYTCAPGIVEKYLHKISGSLPDLIDIHIEVTSVAFSELSIERPSASSEKIRERVIGSRQIN